MQNRIEAVSKANNQAGSGGIKTACHHYWIIETPNGFSSRGVCKLCKEEREFNNTLVYHIMKKK